RRPLEIAPGITLVCHLYVPAAAVKVDITELPKNTFPIKAPEIPRAIEISLFLTSENALVTHWPGKTSMHTSLIDKFSLATTGETAWLVYRETEGLQSGSMSVRNKWVFSASKKSSFEPENLLALVFGDAPNGSRVVLELVVGSQNSADLIKSHANQ
ncbi:MAG TPA: hypothetical protein VNN21_07815, partial [Dehalococcoidia bacterium]|nr:hypothetical protein [Dehalococcoidia bacterium]